jgi:hypothetical protein
MAVWCTSAVHDDSAALCDPRAANTPAGTAGAEGEEMIKPYPTYRQREVLQFLMSGDWVPLLKLIPVGEKLLGNLLTAGWIERMGNLYRITEAGRTAFRSPIPIK